MFKRLRDAIRNRKKRRRSASIAKRRLKADKPRGNCNPSVKHEVYGLKYLLFVMLVVFFAIHSVLDVTAEKTIGVIASQSVDGELSLGLHGEFETDHLDIELEYQGIEFHDAKLDFSYRYDFGWIGASVFQENDWAGYTVDNLNRTNDLGFSLVKSFGHFDIEVAVFNRDGNPAGPVTKYDPDTGEVVSTTPGLTPIEGAHTNAALSVAFDIKQVEIEGKFLRNFAEAPTPQWLVDASTSFGLGPVDMVLSGAYQGQKYQGAYQHQLSSMLTFLLKF